MVPTNAAQILSLRFHEKLRIDEGYSPKAINVILKLRSRTFPPQQESVDTHLIMRPYLARTFGKYHLGDAPKDRIILLTPF